VDGEYKSRQGADLSKLPVLSATAHKEDCQWVPSPPKIATCGR
jgi:hypothetical protein